MIRKALICVALALFVVAPANAQNNSKKGTNNKATEKSEKKKEEKAPPIVHPKLGTKIETDSITVELVGRKQNYAPGVKETADKDINSPKSVNIHPSGKKYYVNSLEGGTTVVFNFETNQKITTIHHRFTQKDAHLWAKPCGLFPFTHYTKNLNTFMGKPVESTFSHNGRYLWVPYYRRSFDINAQDPSAMAVIDTKSDSIVRLFETGPLPKMIATSPDNHYIAVTHWGDNTVGVLDIHSPNIEDWHYTSCLVVDYQLKLNYSLTTSVNRDVNSGYCLRGTVFTPDNKYLLVGCMGGSGGIAVIELASGQYLGRITGMMSNLRHLVIKNGYLYLSINAAGYIQRIKLKDFVDAIPNLGEKQRTYSVKGWENCKVPAGARTIVLSPDGNYLFAACNTASCLAVVDTRSMKQIATISADSYPVGLDISKDGRYVLLTSQGRNNGGGNSVDIFKVDYKTAPKKLSSNTSRPASGVIDRIVSISLDALWKTAQSM